jgi:DNA modification methylase
MSNLTYLDKNLNSIDWDFTSLSNEGLNSFHWYPATFISAIPGSVIPIITKENDTVLDTFCGTSVTGYEAIRLGRRYIGFDNNPIAILISKAKLLFPESNSLLNLFSEVDLFDINKNIKHPNEEILKKWYHYDTYYELLFLLDKISKIHSPVFRIPAQAVFSSILKKTSSQGKHWGWVCDNVIPKPNEIVYKNAIDIFNKALRNYCNSVDNMLISIKYRNLDNKRKQIREQWELNCGDTLSLTNQLKPNSIDLILSSPPYYGVADYVKAQRLSFLWFHKKFMTIEGYSFDDFEQLRKTETGARSTRYNQNSFNDYIEYMDRYIFNCQRVLKKGKYLVLIMGDSKSRNETIGVIDEYAKKYGFEKEYEFQRQIRESRRRLMAKVQNEQIKVYVKK